MEKVVIYGRVSTKDQNCENQIQLLKTIVERNDWDLVDLYVDVGISGPSFPRHRHGPEKMGRLKSLQKW